MLTTYIYLCSTYYDEIMVIMQDDLDNIKTSVFDILINSAVELVILQWGTKFLPNIDSEVDYSQNKQLHYLREYFSGTGENSE